MRATAPSERLADGTRAPGIRSLWEIRQASGRLLPHGRSDRGDIGLAWARVLAASAAGGVALTALLIGSCTLVWGFWAPSVRGLMQLLGAL